MYSRDGHCVYSRAITVPIDVNSMSIRCLHDVYTMSGPCSALKCLASSRNKLSHDCVASEDIAMECVTVQFDMRSCFCCFRNHITVMACQLLLMLAATIVEALQFWRANCFVLYCFGLLMNWKIRPRSCYCEVYCLLTVADNWLKSACNHQRAGVPPLGVELSQLAGNGVQTYCQRAGVPPLVAREGLACIVELCSC